MWLIDTASLHLKLFSNKLCLPPYAILSHTWEDEEISFQDLADLGKVSDRKGLAKVAAFCRLSKECGWHYAWVDTCCIDKSSSADLSEAINSMFDWYGKAGICYVYLADLDPTDPFENAVGNCRWFSRGWTLQELIAPRNVEFYDSSWRYRSNKDESSGVLSKITNIDEEVLKMARNLDTISIAKRMSWASTRMTTRTEDIAYCLLGIFQVNMPLLYGEGHKAFIRLQEEIIKNSNDLSIFAWQTGIEMETDEFRESYNNTRRFCCGLFCLSPGWFMNSGNIQVQKGQRAEEFAITNAGIRFNNAPLFRQRDALVLPLNCYDTNYPGFNLGVYLMPSGSDYLRDYTAELALITYWNPPTEFKSIYIRKQEVFKPTPPFYHHTDNCITFDLSRSNMRFGFVYVEPSDDAWDPIHQTLKIPQNQTGYMIFTFQSSNAPFTFLLVVGETRWLAPWASIFERGQSPAVFESLRKLETLPEVVGQNAQHQVSVHTDSLRLLLKLEPDPNRVDHLTVHVRCY